ncbi:MAG: c-type cytochrome domain-containing protein [Akkermansiaceae bacterium]
MNRASPDGLSASGLGIMLAKRARPFFSHAVQSRLPLCGLGFLLLGCAQKDPERGPKLGFAKDIKGIMTHSCIECHGIEAEESDLDLRTLEAIISGGESGPAIVPGHPEESLLLEMIHDEHMPPEGELLTKDKIELLHKWIAAGAKP